MIQESSSKMIYPEQYNVFDFKKLYFRIVRNWSYFLIAVLSALFMAWLANNYLRPRYEIHSSLIVNEYESGIKQLSLSQNPRIEKNINILGQDHAGRLKSFMLSLRTLEELGWIISWYEKTPLYNRDLYGDEPFQVLLNASKINLKNVPIYISVISKEEYEVTVDYNVTRGNKVENRIKLKQKGKFGVPFEHTYFNFTIENSNKGFNSHYVKKIFFVINNLDNLAMVYRKRLKILSNEKKPDLIELVFSESNYLRGIDFLNALVNRYIDYGLEEKNRVAWNTMNFIDNQLKSVIDSLYHSESRFTSFRSQAQVVDLDQFSGIVLQKKEELESERSLLENRLGYLRNLLTLMNDAKKMKQILVPSAFGITDQTLNSLVSRLSDLYSKREVLSFSVQEKAPSIIVLDNEISLTHNLLLQNVNSLILATEEDIANLEKRTGGFNSQLSLLPRTDQQFNSLKRNFELNNELYTYLLKMRAESAITYASNQPDVKVLDPARFVTARMISPNALFNYIIALLMGVLIPLSLLILNDLISNVILTKEEVSEMTKLPIAGIIVHNKNKTDLVVQNNPQSNIAESFRLLRTNLKFILKGNEPKIIAVQSLIAGEGKSFVSLNLATILAMNNHRVLLVSVDMRMSMLHNILKSNNKMGLSTYLSSQNSFTDILENTMVENLYYVPSGPIPPNPAELLENGCFEQFLNDAKKGFDYIILDSPPVSLVADGIITGRYADVNIFVLRFRYTSKNQLQQINDHEKKRTLSNIALVLNDANRENYVNGNYYSIKNKNYYKEG